jgi:hypothetical protein
MYASVCCSALPPPVFALVVPASRSTFQAVYQCLSRGAVRCGAEEQGIQPRQTVRDIDQVCTPPGLHVLCCSRQLLPVLGVV